MTNFTKEQISTLAADVDGAALIADFINSLNDEIAGLNKVVESYKKEVFIYDKLLALQS